MVGIPDWNDQEHRPTGNREVEKSIRQQRIEICEKCPNITGFKMCKICKCFLPVKTYLYFTDCPINKWPKL